MCRLVTAIFFAFLSCPLAFAAAIEWTMLFSVGGREPPQLLASGFASSVFSAPVLVLCDIRGRNGEVLSDRQVIAGRASAMATCYERATVIDVKPLSHTSTTP